MYIEPKGQQSVGEAPRIRRVTQIKLGQMIFDGKNAFVPQRNRGSGANYTETQTGEPYWIAACRKDGCDSLQARTVQIDDEAREEYWRSIRAMPERAEESTYRSPGKVA
jgi:hypothetical protein